MQDDNKSQVENSPVISAEMADKEKSASRTTGHKSENRGGGKKPLIIGVVIGIVLIAIAGALIAVSINNANREKEMEYSIEPDPETGEIPLFGTDPEKDNSGEAYVKYLNRIISSPNTNSAEKFDASVSLAVYYSAVAEYDKALETIGKYSANSLSTSQLKRYYNVFATIYEAKGDTAKAEEYKGLAEAVVGEQTE